MIEYIYCYTFLLNIATNWNENSQNTFPTWILMLHTTIIIVELLHGQTS